MVSIYHHCVVCFTKSILSQPLLRFMLPPLPFLWRHMQLYTHRHPTHTHTHTHTLSLSLTIEDVLMSVFSFLYFRPLSSSYFPFWYSPFILSLSLSLSLFLPLSPPPSPLCLFLWLWCHCTSHFAVWSLIYHSSSTLFDRCKCFHLTSAWHFWMNELTSDSELSKQMSSKLNKPVGLSTIEKVEKCVPAC